MVLIYRYKTYNIATDNLELSEYYATKEVINSINGAQLVQGTKFEIEEDLLDGNNRVLAIAIEQLDQ